MPEPGEILQLIVVEGFDVLSKVFAMPPCLHHTLVQNPQSQSPLSTHMWIDQGSTLNRRPMLPSWRIPGSSCRR